MEVGHCVHKLALHLSRPDTVFMEKHWDVMRSDDAGEKRTEGAEPTIGKVLDAVEASHPELRGTIRDHGALRRRAFMWYFACGTDWSHETPGTPLPAAVVRGDEPFRVVGAIAGG